MHSAINVENILEVENLFFYDGKEDALQGVTLAVRRGDYVGLVGPNGAGKTTLLKDHASTPAAFERLGQALWC